MMIVSQTFSDSHYASLAGGRLKKRQQLREEAIEYIAARLREDQVVCVTESADEYTSSVTVWYRTGQPDPAL